LLNGDIERKSGKTGGGGSLRGETESLVGDGIRGEERWIEPFGVFSKKRGLYGVPKGFEGSVDEGAVLGGVTGFEWYDPPGLADIGLSMRR
jgi:hypothetical protein